MRFGEVWHGMVILLLKESGLYYEVRYGGVRFGCVRLGMAWCSKVWRGLDKMQYDRTNIEEILANALQDRGISFLEQHPTRSGFVLDFVIAPNIVLEADGPCHDGSKNRRRDRFRDRILKNEGWKVFRLSYQLINNSNLLKNKLDEILYNKY